ncbi:ParM/StbA family protein [Paraburkholderia elongata]|uniref:Actin-like protein N-terminal domain-containing protein n=1 Tax=Paraburkholderia elongata TaxID=2675747 RepID=A0A972NJ23_9BURK|nr:hypothetical protein [Paraburkholderia elongata]NPT53574.1 hypothetical protein [Paraburkholderia elongata]
MEVNVMGLDTGNGRIKAAFYAADGTLQKFAFASVARPTAASALEQTTRPFLGSATEKLVHVRDVTYAVETDSTAIPGPTAGERNEGDDFAMRPEYDALVYSALLRANASTIGLLVLGLPVYLLKYTEALKRRFTGTFDFGHGPRTILRVVVLPQPLGSAIALRLADAVQIDAPSTLLIDVGWGTIDYLTVDSHRSRVQHDRSGGYPGAGAQIFRRVGEMLSRQYGERFDGVDQIDDCYRRGVPLRAHGKSIDLTSFVDRAKRDVALEALRKVRANVKTTEDLHVVFTGGAAPLLIDAAPEIFNGVPITLMKDTVFSNCHGFLLGGIQTTTRTRK